MKDRAKAIIVGATVAAAAAVPAIASAGNTSNAATEAESTQAKSVAPGAPVAATPTTAPAAVASPDKAVIESGDAAEDEAEVDVPATGTDLEKASAAALAHVGEGRVTGTEVGDEESYYEIEITLDDGRQVDVQLDEQFNFVSSEDDGSGEADD